MLPTGELLLAHSPSGCCNRGCCCLKIGKTRKIYTWQRRASNGFTHPLGGGGAAAKGPERARQRRSQQSSCVWCVRANLQKFPRLCTRMTVSHGSGTMTTQREWCRTWPKHLQLDPPTNHCNWRDCEPSHTRQSPDYGEVCRTAPKSRCDGGCDGQAGQSPSTQPLSNTQPWWGRFLSEVNKTIAFLCVP